MELDLTLLPKLKMPLVVILATVSAYMLVWPSVVPLLKSFLKDSPIIPNPDFKRNGTDRSSDAPPPVGFTEHLLIIEAAAPNADTAVWWEYAKQSLTEAEVALAEAKLARKNAESK